MNNQSKFAVTVIKNDLLEKITGNRYRVLATKPYAGKGDLPPGVTVDLLIQEDNAPEGFYGVKEDGITPREGVLFQNMRVTIANGEPAKTLANLKVGDEIRLLDFDQDHSYYIDFNLILRYRNYEKISKENKDNSPNKTVMKTAPAAQGGQGATKNVPHQ